MLLIKEFNSWVLLELTFFRCHSSSSRVVLKHKTGKINYQGTEEDKKLNYINIFEKCALCSVHSAFLAVSLLPERNIIYIQHNGTQTMPALSSLIFATVPS